MWQDNASQTYSSQKEQKSKEKSVLLQYTTFEWQLWKKSFHPLTIAQKLNVSGPPSVLAPSHYFIQGKLKENEKGQNGAHQTRSWVTGHWSCWHPSLHCCAHNAFTQPRPRKVRVVPFTQHRPHLFIQCTAKSYQHWHKATQEHCTLQLPCHDNGDMDPSSNVSLTSLNMWSVFNSSKARKLQVSLSLKFPILLYILILRKVLYKYAGWFGWCLLFTNIKLLVLSLDHRTVFE